MNEKTFHAVKLTDEHIRVINRALEVYYRMRSGQIGIALDTAYDKCIDYDDRDTVEKIVRKLIIDDENLSHPGAAYGFNSNQIGDAKIAYEIRSTFRQFLAVKNNDGYFDYSTVDFRDPLKASDEPFPEIVDFKRYKDIEISPQAAKKILALKIKQNYNAMWEYIDSIKGIPSGDKKEIIYWNNTTYIRVWKPRKNNKNGVI